LKAGLLLHRKAPQLPWMGPAKHSRARPFTPHDAVHKQHNRIASGK